ncbi:response regulator transcription factor [Streptomyces sp. NPDC053560]|uniref:response regulator transcription factor n=1 Tax=Streptomyces sp. NPDC053560 TaxID=3365711 RepID=UPI0037CEB489
MSQTVRALPHPALPSPVRPGPPPLTAQPAGPWRVLVVENDARTAQTLTRSLERHGHRVRTAATGAAALREHHHADVILIDLELPDVDGLEICRSIAAVCDTPLLAVTARDSEVDRVLGLQAGADDYLVKPYGFRELLARMGAVMRRARPAATAGAVLQLGPLVVEQTTRTVHLHGRPVPLTRKEFDLLLLLASRPGAVVTRRQILQQVWQDTDTPRSRTLDTHVNGLRRKLGSGDWIVTVRGVGFRLGQPRNALSGEMRSPA